MSRRQSWSAGGKVRYWRPLKRRGKWRARWVDGEGNRSEQDLAEHAHESGVDSFAYKGQDVAVTDSEVRGYSATKAAGLVEEIATQRRIAFDDRRRDPEKAQPKEVTVGKVLDEWLGIFKERVRKGYCKESTLRERERDVAIYCDLLGAETVFLAIDYARIEYLFTHQMTKGSPRTHRPKKSISGSSLYRHAQQLRRVFRWAKKKGYTQLNPLVPLMEEPFVEDWKQAVRDGRDRGEALSEEECKRLLDACRLEPHERRVKAKRNIGGRKPGTTSEEEVEFTQFVTGAPPHLHLAVLLGLQQGLRKSIICGNRPQGLRWRNVDLDTETLTIDKAAKPNQFGVVEKAQKGKRRFTAPLHPEVVAALREELKRLGRVPKPSDPIIGVEFIDTPYKTALRRAGLDRPGVNFQSLRRTFSTRVGVISWEHMQMLMDHRLPGTAAQHYARLGQKVVLDRLRRTLHEVSWLEPKSDISLEDKAEPG